jgi:hypothetical protein
MRLTADNAKAVCDFVHGASKAEVPVHHNERGEVLIDTLEGTMTASVGDFVIEGVSGSDFYPCKPEIFEATYEEAEPA